MTVSWAGHSAGREQASAARRRHLKTACRLALMLVVATVALASALLTGDSSRPAAAADPPTAQITISPHDLGSGTALGEFSYIVNVDNAHLGDATNIADRPM